jgi:hypothetical protein
MSVDASFEGGPADGLELAIIGGRPSYLLLMPNPSEDSPMRWLVVGSDFDDHWPGQQRYELRSWRGTDHATYVHVDG